MSAAVPVAIAAPIARPAAAIFSSDRLISFAVFAERWLILSMLPEKEAVFAFRSMVSVPTVTLMAVMDRFESLPGFPEIFCGLTAAKRIGCTLNQGLASCKENTWAIPMI